MAGNKKGTIKYLSQVDTNPPKFLFFVNNVKAFHFSYRRYLENKIREKYGFHGTPITIELRDSMDKFKGKGKGK
jgi:GTP-binding protein